MINKIKLKNSSGIEEEIEIEHVINDKENYYYFKTKDNENFRIISGSVEVKDNK